MNKTIFALVLLLLTGCAVGPLVSHETARTVGNSNSEILAGYGRAGLVVKYNYGLSDNLDFGVHYESLSMGLRLKYAMLNAREKGWSFAVAGGTGLSYAATHYYGDLIGSYLYKGFEPYATLRIVHVKTSPIEVGNQETSSIHFTISSFDYSYGQGILGTRYWFNPNWHLSAEASTLFSLSDIKASAGLLVGAALGYRF